MKRDICDEKCQKFMLRFGEFLRLNYQNSIDEFDNYWEHNVTKKNHTTELLDFYLKETKQ